MPFVSETAFNVELGRVLSGLHPHWGGKILVEERRALEDAALKPDLVVMHPGGQPVVIETEFEPARTVEQDARARLGHVVAESGKAIEQVIAVRIPASLRDARGEAEAAIRNARLEYCVLWGSPDCPARWPKAGWLSGHAADLATCIENAALSEELLARGIQILERAVTAAAGRLNSDEFLGFRDPPQRIAEALRQREGPQTTRMAMAILANALSFHQAIAGIHGIPALDDLRGQLGKPLKSEVLRCWERVMGEVNYWPIFSIASEILRPIRTGTAQAILHLLAKTAGELSGLGVTSSHDLSARVFQRLIADRKFLATFYTLPASAALLGELAVDRLTVEWENAETLAELQIADLACGTGTLLSAAYHAMRTRHRRAGGDDAALHAAMMQWSLVAADIMPSATHLAASMLSSAHPTVTFRNTRVYTMPYGSMAQEHDETIALGSLDLLSRETRQSLFGTGGTVVRGEGGDEEIQDLRRIVLPHEGADLVIMNPPFTRPTNHKIASVPVPSFAGFNTSEREQREMSKRLKILRRGLEMPAGHGNAGLASNFLDLAHVKVRPRGVIALVLPITVLRGEAWSNARELLCAKYCDLTVVTIAAAQSSARNFSADTNMAEALIIATRGADGVLPEEEVLYVNLNRRPATLLEATEVARSIRRLPFEGDVGHLRFEGGRPYATWLRAPLNESGCASVRNPSVATVALALSRGELWLPRMTDPLPMPLVPLGEIGHRGLLDRDIAGSHPSGEARGPFEIVPIVGAPTYPVLWAHDAVRERQIVVAPDRAGEVRPGCGERAVKVWGKTASRLHLCRDFSLSGQSLAACMTPDPAIGGRAWPNFILQDSAWEKFVALWANTTIGLLHAWWTGSRQHGGRAIFTVQRLPDLLAPDPRRLPKTALPHTKRLFDKFGAVPLLPANEAYRDANRQALDRAVLVELLGLPTDILEPLSLLRRQWCAEPTVHGGKRSRPPDSDS